MTNRKVWRMAIITMTFGALCQISALSRDMPKKYDVVISGGTVFDGTGRPGVASDVAISNGRIVKIGKIDAKSAKNVIDAKGKAVAPGFINMLSWATESLMVDGRGMSDIKQGVTLEVMGEGWSMGPLSPAIKPELIKAQSDFKYDINWTTLGDYLDMMVKKGVSPNIASFVGAATVRMHELGSANRKATPEELARMQDLVRQAMREGAMGVGSSLIYAPGNYADTDELIALSKAAAPFGGRYISHMRSEADNVEGALDELLRIAREAKIGAEVYHMKLGGKDNWSKFDAIAAKIEKARTEGLDITADMYTYVAGATGLDASMPTWVQADGYDAWATRLKDPAIRARVIKEMNAKGEGWENLFFAAGDGQRMLLLGFKNPKLRGYIGKTLAEVAVLRGTTLADTAIDLVIEDGSRVEVAYFLMSEENVRKTVQLPYMTFGSDAEASAPEGVFLSSSTHPRAYGTFARLLGKYVRDEKLISLPQAIYRLTALPAKNLKLRERGMLKPGYFADVVVFDPETIADKATYTHPMQYAVGVSDVFVNGVQVLKDGEHTGAKPGQVVRGPGWAGWKATKSK
jgi:N-acyl-D-amino-acid deacylase